MLQEAAAACVVTSKVTLVRTVLYVLVATQHTIITLCCKWYIEPMYRLPPQSSCASFWVKIVYLHHEAHNKNKAIYFYFTFTFTWGSHIY